MRKNSLLLSGLNGGIVVGLGAFIFAYVWSELAWLREPKVMAISGFIYGFAATLLFRFISSKFGAKAAVLSALTITILVVASLLVVFD